MTFIPSSDSQKKRFSAPLSIATSSACKKKDDHFAIHTIKLIKLLAM